MYILFIISLHSAKTKELVDEYEQQCQHFMTNDTVNQFKELLFSSLNTSSKLPDGRILVTLKILIKCGTATVNDLRELVALFDVSCCEPKYHKGYISITALHFITNSEDQMTKKKEVPQVFYVEEPIVLDQSQHEPGINQNFAGNSSLHVIASLLWAHNTVAYMVTQKKQ